MKLAIISTAIVSLAFALPASAQHVPDTPAVGTRTSSGATGFVPPNGMVNGSTSAAAYQPQPTFLPRGSYTRDFDREARLLSDPRYAPYEELRYRD